MTKSDLLELKALSIDIILNAIDNNDAWQLTHGIKLFFDSLYQLERGANL